MTADVSSELPSQSAGTPGDNIVPSGQRSNIRLVAVDLDGTLLDIAPTPSSVIVPPDVPRVLRALRLLLDDAIAIVTGRPIEMIDALLGELRTQIAQK